MAQKVNVILVDDLDEGEADETVTFGLDGVQYEIDLSTANATELRNGMDKFIEAARRISGRKIRTASTAGTSSAGRGSASQELTGAERGHLRAWAAQNGIHVAERGRIAAKVVSDWRAAGSPQM